MRKKERAMRTTTTIVSPPYFISFFFFFFFFCTSLFYVCTRMCSPKDDNDVVEKKKKMSFLHICKLVRARTLCQRHRQKSNYSSLRRKNEKELFSFFLPVYVYMCNDVIVTSMPCLLLLFASEQINILFFLSAYMYIYIEYIYGQKKRNSIDSVAMK